MRGLLVKATVCSVCAQAAELLQLCPAPAVSVDPNPAKKAEASGDKPSEAGNEVRRCSSDSMCFLASKPTRVLTGDSSA